jgi:hypothetical protein
MMCAVAMARTGQFSNWWSIAARLRVRGCEDDALVWTGLQKQWLNQLCAEARSGALPPPSY